MVRRVAWVLQPSYHDVISCCLRPGLPRLPRLSCNDNGSTRPASAYDSQRCANRGPSARLTNRCSKILKCIKSGSSTYLPFCVSPWHVLTIASELDCNAQMYQNTSYMLFLPLIAAVCSPHVRGVFASFLGLNSYLNNHCAMLEVVSVTIAQYSLVYHAVIPRASR